MRLNHVTAIVTDLDRAILFYTRLGLKMIVLEQPRYARFVVPGNEATFSIEVIPAARRMGPEQTHIYFECDDVDATCASLRAAGLHIAQPPTDMEYLWREARLEDPDGHDIRLYTAGINRLYPPWRLSDSLPARGEMPSA